MHGCLWRSATICVSYGFITAVQCTCQADLPEPATAGAGRPAVGAEGGPAGAAHEGKPAAGAHEFRGRAGQGPGGGGPGEEHEGGQPLGL